MTSSTIQRSALLPFGLLFSVYAAAQAPAASANFDRAHLESFIDGVVHQAMQQDQIAGVTVAVIDPSGAAMTKGYGIATPARAVTPDTLFPVHSISKTLVWIAILQLVEEGKIGLDDPINSHLPSALQIPDEGFDKPILIRHLMEHAAGFEDSLLGHLIVDRASKMQPLLTYLATHRVHRVREPDNAVVYSNFGATLAGVIVGQVSGRSWEEYAEQKILRPLGMSTATFRQPYPPELAKSLGLPSPMPKELADQLTAGFRPVHGRLEVGPREYTNEPPAGTLSASATDMVAYMRALLDPQLMAREGVLSAKTALEMRKPMGPNVDAFGAMHHGFATYNFPGNIVGFGHGGDSAYQVSSMVLIPALGIGIFASANTPTGAALVHNLAGLIVSEFEGESLPPPFYSSATRVEAMRLIGNYRNLRRPYFRTERSLYDLFIDTISVNAAENGDLLFAPGHASSPGSGLGGDSRLVPLGKGMYRDAFSDNRVLFQPIDARMRIYDPAGATVWERIGFFDAPAWAGVVSAVTALTALLVTTAFIRGLFARPSGRAVNRLGEIALFAASFFWITGFTLVGLFLFKILSAETRQEILFWYPSLSLVWGCWAFALAATFSVLAVPSLAISTGVAKKTSWGKSGQFVVVVVFLVCSATFWRLNLLGFSGW